MMNKFDSGEAKRILVFNPYKKLIAIYHSTLEAAKSLEIHTQSVHYACTGRCIAVKRRYFRHLSNDVEITLEDLGTLRLEEYDDLCGVERKLYPNSKMERKGFKYSKKQTNKEKNEN
jgi:hypothetical protein